MVVAVAAAVVGGAFKLRPNVGFLVISWFHPDSPKTCPEDKFGANAPAKHVLTLEKLTPVGNPHRHPSEYHFVNSKSYH